MKTENPDHYDVAVIGAGPAGLFCAIHASAQDVRVLLLEKNAHPGKKLLLSGTGQCNITHSGEIRDFLSHYGDHGKQIKPALLGFSNSDLIRFFSQRGLSMLAEDNGKIFPQTRCASDVLAVLMRECRKKGVILECGNPVVSVRRIPGGFQIDTPARTYRSGILVITTGGESYPQTGSTGDGYRFSEELGQPLIITAPALTPLNIRNYPFADLPGISFEGMHFSVWRGRKKILDARGDVLLTHAGLSGPGILDASRTVLAGDEIKLSFIGDMNREEFAADLRKRTAENRSWQVSTLLAVYPIPERLNRKLLALSGIPPGLKCAHFSAVQRSALITNCTELPLTVSAPGDYSVAMVTRGGVALDGLNTKTMESRIIPNLYFAGEVLDVDGDTGGYNLQAAFSTGFLAGKSIRKKTEFF